MQKERLGSREKIGGDTVPEKGGGSEGEKGTLGKNAKGRDPKKKYGEPVKAGRFAKRGISRLQKKFELNLGDGEKVARKTRAGGRSRAAGKKTKFLDLGLAG